MKKSYKENETLLTVKRKWSLRMSTFGLPLLFMLMTALQLTGQCTDPTPEILGDFSVCPGEEMTYNVDSFMASNVYAYTLDAGGTIVSATDGSVTILWDEDPGGPYLLNLSETDATCVGNTFANVLIEGDAILVCNDNLNISLADDCELVLTPDIVLESPEFPDDSYTIEVNDENGNPAPTTLGVAYLGQTLEVIVTHTCSNNKCWGNITLEDKLAPEIMCENDTLTCDEFAVFTMSEPNLVSDNCGDASFDFVVSDEEQPCGSDFSLIRTITWTATDASGNISEPCSQTISVERVIITDLNFPLNYDGLPGNNEPLSCSGSFPLTSEGYPAPSFTGTPGGDAGCSTIEWTYTDISLPLCDATCTYSNSNYKVIRTFVAVDWCTGDIREEQQIIKVEDKIDPSLQAIEDMTRPVNPFDCSAQILLPVAQATDNCTADESISYTYSSSEGEIINGVLYLDAPATTMGTPIVITVEASDCCGNSGTTSFEISLIDDTPPVVVADAHEVISLLPNGVATMYATSLDDGSYDNCGPVAFFAKRMDNGAGNQSIDLFPPSGNDNAQFNEVVHFFCSDVDPDVPVMVQFQVCDDASKDGVFGNSNDNCNIAMIEVTVQDKYAPILQCPADMTISCTEFEDIDISDMSQLNDLFGTATVIGTCNPQIMQSVNGTAELECGSGVIIRTFTSTTAGGSASCTQNIAVNAFANNLLTCDRISFEGLSNNTYNWCEVNDNVNDNDDDLPAINIDGCEGINVAEVNVNTAGLCTTAGIQVSIDTFNYANSSACKKYIVHYEVIDQCLFDENYVNPITGQIDPFNTGNGYFEFYLEYNVVDTDAPVLTCDIVNVESDICEGYTGTVSIVAEDACTPEEYLVYEFKVDVGANGSVDLPINGGWFQGNAVTGNILGLTAIPAGSHDILWRVNDGCGNEEVCTQRINIDELDKAPTPYCLGGLSTAVMNTNGSVAIWATDFDNGSQDDCGSPLTFSMIPETVADASSNPFTASQPSWEFSCDDIPNGVFEVIEIRIYVADETGAFDYCTVTLRVEDNEANFCPDNLTTGTISGNIKTEGGVDLKEAKVELMSMQPEYPVTATTDAEGNYSFQGLLYNDYEITAEENSNYLNGVTTLDIVLVQKHILSISVLESPYKLIAADVNNDCTVNGVDIIQIRKLLLGKYADNVLPANESWRFVNENQEFDELVQPCEFMEEFEIEEFGGTSTQNNFVAVKVADINESFTNNFTEEDSENRTDNSLDFILDNQAIKAGQVARIPVYAANMNNVKGFQFALTLENMMVNGIEAGALGVTRDYVNMNRAEEGVLSVSFDNVHGMTYNEDEVLFTILATANTNLDLSNVTSISNRVMISEAYVGTQLELVNVDFQLRDGEDFISVDAEFSLLQNEPNPFADQTNIGFELPKSGEASLKIYDLQGKMLFARAGTFAKGYNYITVSKSDIGITGELFYQLEFDGNLQTKKMILID